MSETTVPGAEIVNGVAYLPGPKGNLRRVENIAAMDLVVHEQVYKMIGFALGLSAEIARFKCHSYGDLDALDALMAQEYGVTRDPAVLGNRTYPSADGKYLVRIKVNTPQVAGPELQQAKALIDQIILEEGATASPVMAALVSTAFGVGKQGKVDFSRLRELRDLNVPDPRWPAVQRAITDGMKDGVSKNYITYHQRNPLGGWTLIPLDLAGVEITEDALNYPSLRRQVAELENRVQEAAELLSLAQDYAEDGAMATMLELMDRARKLLGDDLGEFDLTHPGCAGSLEASYVRLWLSTVPPEVLARAVGAQVARDIAVALAASDADGEAA